jgi:hypothetical protein
MTDHASPARASRELDAILSDMAGSGADARRAARRIRRAVDCILLSASLPPPASLPVRLNVDTPPVTEALADQLVVHHLGLAASYYEASGPGLDMALLAARQERDGSPALCLAADRAWLRELGRAYREMDGGEDDQPD